LPTPYDVPTPVLIEKLAKYLKDNIDEIVPPLWTPFVKTGSHTQRPPQNSDWWFTRCASLLRKIYIKGPIGTSRLRSKYGGRVDRGVRPEHVRKGGGAAVRKAIQQLESAALVQSSGNKGRVVTQEGRRLLDILSTEIKKDLEKEIPELKKY